MLNKICAAAYTALLGLAAIAAYRTSDRDWNWDALAYTGCAVSWSESDPVKIHREVYSEAKKELPVPAFKLLAESNPYRADLASNPFHFVEQLPFYDGKVLYVALIAGMHRFGATHIEAMKLISAAGFFALGLVFFRWTRIYVAMLPAALFSAAFVLCPPILNSARIFSPDALSTAMIAWALYALFERASARRAALIGLALLSGAVFIRNDTVLLAVLVVAYLAFAPRSPVRLQPIPGTVLIGLLVGFALTLSHFGGGYGWRMSFYHGLVERVPAPAEAGAPPISLADYLHAAAVSAREALDWSSLALFAFLGVASLLLVKRKTWMRDLLFLNLGFSLIRFLAYPGFEERYYISTYLMVCVTFVSALAVYRGGLRGEPR